MRSAASCGQPWQGAAWRSHGAGPGSGRTLAASMWSTLLVGARSLSSSSACRVGRGDAAPSRTNRRRPRSPARGSGRDRAPATCSRTSASTAAVAGAGASGARRSSARAAVSSSIASTRVRPSTERRSLRAADQPIDTWSSCIAEDGIESTLAGAASRLISLTIAACVYCAIMWPESTPGSSARNGGSPLRAGGVEHAVGAALAHRREVGGGDGQEVEHVGHRRAVEVAVALDAAVGQHDRVVDRRGQLALGDRLGVVDRVAHGARHLRRAAQRVRVLHADVALAVRRDDARTRQKPHEVARRRRLARDAAAAPAARRRTRGRCRAAPRRSSRRRCRRCAPAHAGP